MPPFAIDSGITRVALIRLVEVSYVHSFARGRHVLHRPHRLSRSDTFFPCDDAKIAMIVQDSALATRYHTVAQSNEAVFVRMRGVKGHEGSIYGGQRSFYVQQILEVRPRAAGECPGVAQPIAPLLHS